MTLVRRAGGPFAEKPSNSCKRLIYRRGDAVCFSDLNEALGAIPDEGEKERLIKMLSRRSTLLVQLHVREGEDIEPLVRYWSKDGNGKNIRSLLASLARTPGGGSMDITHLLPRFGRARLYTFPYPTDDARKKHRDCAWTAMNFFNRETDDRYYDFDYTQQVINRDYYPIQDDPEFGDIVWFSDDGGTPLHVAVYIADDILFTKNGADFNEPWILTEMKDLQADYAGPQQLHVNLFRRKGLELETAAPGDQPPGLPLAHMPSITESRFGSRQGRQLEAFSFLEAGWMRLRMKFRRR